MLAVFHVALTGDNSNDGSAGTPFRTIQAAVDAAAAAEDGDDEIRVAGGTYNQGGVDLAINIPSDDELDSLDIVGGYNAAFTIRDLVGTPTNYAPQGAGAQVLINDVGATIDGVNFTFDGTADGIVVGAASVTLVDVGATNAVDGIRVSGHFLTMLRVNASSNINDGFESSGRFLTFRDLTLQSNGSGLGGRLTNVTELEYETSDSAADFVEIVNHQIRHTRNGDVQQAISYNRFFELSVSTLGGDDTIRIGGPTDTVVVQQFDGGAGTDVLIVWTMSGHGDLVDIAGDTITNRPGPHPNAFSPEILQYTSFSAVQVATAGGNDTITVLPGFAADFLGIDGQDENDAIEINLGRPDLDIVYDVKGGGGSNGLTVFTRSANDNEVEAGFEQVLVRPRQTAVSTVVKTIDHENIRGISIFADAGNDFFEVASSNLGAQLQSLSMFGQGDNDLAMLGLTNPATTTATLRFDGGAGSDNRLLIDTVDNTNNGDDQVVIDSKRVQVRLGPNALSNPIKSVQYANTQLLNVFTRFGADTVTISQANGAPTLPAVVKLQLDDENPATNDSADTVTINAANIPDSVTIDLEMGDRTDLVDINLAAGALQPTIIVKADVQDGLDKVRLFAAAAGSSITAGNLDSGERLRLDEVEFLFFLGGAGNDTFTSNAGMPTVFDGQGGNDLLTGGTGRNVLIGGGGADSITGNFERDLLISGFITFDQHIEALDRILREWRSGRTFDERRLNLTNGTGSMIRENGDVFLVPNTTVFNDGLVDTLTGLGDPNWFLARLNQDVLTDLAGDDFATNV